MDFVWRFEDNSPKKDSRLLPYESRIDEDEKFLHLIPAKKDDNESNEILITRNEELRYDHYLIGDFDLLVSDEVKNKIKSIGWNNLRSFFEKELEASELDRFGKKSIDPDKNDYTTQQLRSVNILSEKFNMLVGEEIVLKEVIDDPSNYTQQNIGGKKRSTLLEQFISMRRLASEREKLFTPEQKEILDICPVCIAIQYPSHKEKGIKKEWIAMKKIEGVPIKDERYAAMGRSYAVLGIDNEEHKELLKTFNIDERWWERIIKEFQHKGLHLTDLKGQNVLVSEKEEKKHYTIIDQ